MEQKRLYRTLETLSEKNFGTTTELLKEVIDLVLRYENVDINGGRVWKLDVDKKAYRLLYQAGNVTKIDKNFLLKVDENDVFEKIAEKRTVLADETNRTLLEKGIFKYSASGVGRKIKIDEKYYYEYLLALNSSHIDDKLRYTLNIVATYLTSFLNERAVSADRKNLIEHLDKAKQLQRSILPDHKFSFHNYEMFGVTVPAEILGGDFFDYVRIGNDEERLGIVVGDAASKGLSAAAEAMYISGAVRMASLFQIKISPLMYRLNNLINKIFSDDRFTTMFYGEVSNDSRGLFLYANAGHNPPIFFDSASSRLKYLNVTGPLLGPAPNSKFETDSINFHKGDLLVIYSDGIVEAANNEYEFYGEKRLEKLILENRNSTPKELTYKILDDVMKFSTTESKYQDDKTIVVIKRIK